MPRLTGALQTLSLLPTPGIFRPGDSCSQAGRWALSRVRSTEGLPLTAGSPPGRYALLEPGRWVLSLVLGFGNGRKPVASPTPCGGGGMAMAKRPIDRYCHTRGLKDKSPTI